MDKEEKEVTLEDLYWATLSKNDIIRILKDNCSKNIILEKQKFDLETKLAESEENKLLAENCIKNLTKKLKEKEDDFAYIKKISHELGLQNVDYEKQVALLKSSENCLAENVKQLKQQLAEKTKECEELNKFMSDKADEIEDLKERISNKITSAYGAELMARDTQWHLEKEIHELKHSQNQTAIAELEKVKEFCKNSDGFNKYGQSVRVECVVDFIDCQIEDLRGDK